MPSNAAAISADSISPRGQNGRKHFYIPALDGLRAVAFLLVFVAHAGLDKVVPGGLGVTIFFFLSGYLITTLLRIEAKQTNSISLWKFYLRRARRILAPMYITLALAYGLSYLGALPIRGNFTGAASALFYFYNYADLILQKPILPSGIGVLWSLMIEEHFYFAFPLVYGMFCRSRFRRLVQTRILIGACMLPLIWRCILVFGLHTSLTATSLWTYSATDCRFDAILWGCVMAIACNPWFGDKAGWMGRRKGLYAAAGIALILLTLVIRNPQFRETLRYTMQSIALFPIFYYCVAARSFWTHWLEWGWLKQIGQLSYSMYLIHDVLLAAIPWLLHWGKLLAGALAFALTLGYSIAMRSFVERPLRRLVP